MKETKDVIIQALQSTVTDLKRRAEELNIEGYFDSMAAAVEGLVKSRVSVGASLGGFFWGVRVGV